jgi:hypothetical protein
MKAMKSAVSVAAPVRKVMYRNTLNALNSEENRKNK